MADKHENPADVLLHELVDMPGFETYVVCNNQGIVLKYVGMEYERAVHTATVCLNRMEKSKVGMAGLMPPGDGEVENVRLKTEKYELIMSQMNNFTMIVTQSFHQKHEGDEEEDGAEDGG